MKRVFKFVLVALTAAAVVVACQKPPQEEQKPDEEQQKPGDEYTGPVQGTSAWSVIGAFLDSDWKKDYVCAEKDGAIVLKNVKLSKDNKIKFRKDKDWAVNRGINKENEAAELAAGTPTKAIQGGGDIIIPADGIYDLYYFAEKEAIVYVAKDAALPEIPDFTEETPEGLEIDGSADDWAELDASNVVSLVLPDEAEKTWLKSAKVYYDDKLYVLLELSDEAIAYSKTRFYLFFDTANLGTLTQNWSKSTIDYMTEGKIIVNAAPADYSSSIHAHNAEVGGWNWTDTGVSPTFVCKGVGNIYEFSMDYDQFPGTLPEAFNLGLQVADSDYATTGFLPQAEKMARIVKVGATDPGEGGEEDTWDYTPSAEYLAEDNLWKAVDANHTIESFYNPNWAGEKDAPELAFKESTYKVTLPDACSNDWNAQYWIRPTEQLVLDPAKKYSLKFTVNASTDGQFYVKLYQKGVDGAWSTETNPRVELTANESYEIKLDDFSPITTPQDLLIDFSHHEANTTFYIKDIILKVTGEVPQPVEWDYAPSEEYLASSNLWKAKAAGHEMYYYYNASGADWNGSDIVDSTVPFLTINQSTYELNYAAATNELWQKQFFVFPAEGNEIPFEADKTYKIKVTLGTDAVKTPGFFKLAKYNDSNVKKEGEAIWEKGNVSLAGSEPLVIESPEITGVECSNINLMFAFGGNSADTKVYIKDIIVEEVKEQVTLTDLSTINALTANADFELNAIVAASIKISDYNSAAIVTDGTNCFYLFFNPASNNTYKVGDLVNAKGTISVYNHLIESAKNPTVTVLEEGVAVPEIAPKEITSFDTFLSTNQPTGLYTATGKYVIDNSYTNLVIDGCTAKGSLSDNIDEKWAGKTVKVTGWFTGANKSGDICYLRVTEIEEVAAAGIKIDGDFSDWAAVEGKTTANDRITTWKAYSDADNLYIYYEITASKIKTKTANFDWEPYIYIGIDTDNNTATGEACGGGTSIAGCEVQVCTFPWRGETEGDGSADVVFDPSKHTFVNGSDANGWIKRPVSGSSVGNPVIYGKIDGSKCYIELSIARSLLGSPTGKISIESAMSWYPTGAGEVTLK